MLFLVKLFCKYTVSKTIASINCSKDIHNVLTILSLSHFVFDIIGLEVPSLLKNVVKVKMHNILYTIYPIARIWPSCCAR